MTIEEAIKHAEEAAKEQEELYKVCPSSESELFYCDGTKDCKRMKNGKNKGCQKCAKEYKQLAEWLKDYKRLLEQQPVTTTNNDEPITVIYPTIVGDDAIRRDMAKKWICKTCPDDSECQRDCDVIKGIDALPPVTPQQKYGKWIKVKSGDKDFPESIVCSRCSNENSHLDFNENAEPIGKVFVTSKFCPYCGAKMQESEDKG